MLIAKCLNYQYKGIMMSLDINGLASEFGCSIDDIKELIGSFIQESKDMFEVISISLDGDDFDNIHMGADAIKTGAQNIQLLHMQQIAEKMLSGATAQDQESCSEAFTAMKAHLSELESVI